MALQKLWLGSLLELFEGSVETESFIAKLVRDFDSADTSWKTK